MRLTSKVLVDEWCMVISLREFGAVDIVTLMSACSVPIRQATQRWQHKVLFLLIIIREMALRASEVELCVGSSCHGISLDTCAEDVPICLMALLMFRLNNSPLTALSSLRGRDQMLERTHLEGTDLSDLEHIELTFT